MPQTANPSDSPPKEFVCDEINSEVAGERDSEEVTQHLVIVKIKDNELKLEMNGHVICA